MAYSIGEAAKKLRVSTNSLRGWEKQGFIPRVSRRPTDHRQYSEDDIKAIEDYLSKKN